MTALPPLERIEKIGERERIARSTIRAQDRR
jgi:hypothetical protein